MFALNHIHPMGGILIAAQANGYIPIILQLIINVQQQIHHAVYLVVTISYQPNKFLIKLDFTKTLLRI